MSKFTDKLRHFETLSNKISSYLEELSTAQTLLLAAQTDVARIEAEVDAADTVLSTHLDSYDSLRDTAIRCVPPELPKILHDAFVDAVHEAVKRTLKAEEISLRFKAVTASQAFDRAIIAQSNAEKHVQEIAKEHRKVVTEFKRLKEEMDGYASAIALEAGDRSGNLDQAPPQECAATS